MREKLSAFLVALSLISCNSFAPQAGQDARGQLRLSDASASWLLKQARSKLTKNDVSRSPAPIEVFAPRDSVLFVTGFSSGRTTWPRPLRGEGENLAGALDAVVASADRVSRSPAAVVDRFQIDVVVEQTAPSTWAEMVGEQFDTPATKFIDPGIEGLIFSDGCKTLWVLPSEIIRAGLFMEDTDAQSSNDLLERAAAYAGLNRNEWRSRYLKISRFRTESYAEDVSQNRALRLVRLAVSGDDFNRSQLASASRAGGDYLVRMQKEDGSLHYSYDAGNDRVSEREYNIVRHAGVVFALLQLYASTRESRYLEAAAGGINFLKTRFRPPEKNRKIYVVDDDGKAKLGAAGLSLLAMTRQIELDPKRGSLGQANQLAQFILSMQNENGSFRSYYRLRGDEPTESVSLYYPGEAILGLVGLYRITREPRLIQSARKGADYLIESQRKMKQFPQDAWLMQALEELQSFKREDRYFDHALALAESMMADQFEHGAAPGYAGGFGPEMPRSTPAASRAEGLLSAYRMAIARRDNRANRILGSLMASARFQLSMQFDNDNSFFLPNSKRAHGGFRASFTSTRIRIDFVQHNVCSFLGLSEILR